MLKNIANFNNTNDYLPLFNAVLITDLFVILLLNLKVIKSKVLRQWYSQYNLSAVIADVLVILIVLIIARAIYYYIFDTFSILNFIILAVMLQISHDVLFYYTNGYTDVCVELDSVDDVKNYMELFPTITPMFTLDSEFNLITNHVNKEVTDKIIDHCKFLFNKNK